MNAYNLCSRDRDCKVICGSISASRSEFNSLYKARKKKPLSNPKNLHLALVETSDPMAISEEYCHEQSAQLRMQELQRCKQRDDELLLKEVLVLADVCDPGLRVTMEAFRAG